jgi:alkaline phosphatase
MKTYDTVTHVKGKGKGCRVTCQQAQTEGTRTGLLFL